MSLLLLPALTLSILTREVIALRNELQRVAELMQARTHKRFGPGKLYASEQRFVLGCSMHLVCFG